MDNNCNGLIDEPLPNVITQKQQDRVGEQEVSLHLTAAPNPTSHYFVLHIQSASTKPIQLRMLDGVGRVFETRTSYCENCLVMVGQQYKAGVYYAEVKQSDRRVTVKLIKQ